MRPRLLSVAACSLAIVGFIAGYRFQPSDRLIFLSVGQGDSALVQMQGANVLIDAGPARDGYDAGSALVLPKLRERGVTALSILFLTHPDGDHIGGVNAVLQRYPEAKVAMNSAFKAHPDVRNIPRRRILWVTGQTDWKIGDATIRCFAPPAGENDNDGSLFLCLEDHGAKAVMCGDAPSAVEEQVAAMGDWSAQVMEAGHHGSRSSSSEAWLREVKPTYVAISCGRDNMYGHPHAQTLDMARRTGAKVHRTDEEGDLVFIVKGGRYNFEP